MEVMTYTNVNEEKLPCKNENYNDETVELGAIALIFYNFSCAHFVETRVGFLQTQPDQFGSQLPVGSLGR